MAPRARREPHWLLFGMKIQSGTVSLHMAGRGHEWAWKHLRGGKEKTTLAASDRR